ncbi:NAD(P)H-dependent glycerol-3-phosphate dehydrogenase [Brachybacterium paraconglomeratum]|uniref:NAD(P)H-dependent glycerol-3-phosphate dehydrogenase n=1 Tax=Brachybacterium paraconglomeratum TaxID=173362 RepID=UPI00026C6BB7|nr:NAD(P)H-dependent glycerol-3-phosphate dehydrogenase [Brachybacterium paraconglomeratum]MCT1908981.1 NAD(P)-dependent glycerol-3-phosphate dehydrogenase [Brachybacterium paraconglomeratum]
MSAPRRAPRLTVLGAGSWGTTFAQVLADGGAEVTLWARREEVAREIRTQHRNSAYLGDLELPASLRATADVAAALEGADGVVVAIPAQSMRATLAPWPALPAVPVLSLTKGIERGTDARISEILARAGGADPSLVGVLSGPNLSGEIAERRPCASVVAAPDEELAETFASWCSAPYLRAYTSTDVVGVEVAGAVKNVIAIAVGAATGLGHGHNTTASLITRGLAEITRLGVALGGRRETFPGLAGMGDLVATCSSPLSRNHRLGLALGRGLDVAAAAAEVGQTAEGVATARAVADIAARHGVDMPITRSVVAVVDHGARIDEVTTALLSRSVRPE